MKLSFRPAREEDAPRLLAIYAAYLGTSVTFEEVLPSEEEFRSRIRTISAFYPYLVCEREGKILGYAYAHRQLERAAYRWSAELSVYLAEEARGLRLGEALYRRLLALLTLQGIQTVNAIVTSPNPRSERLHERMGFAKTGFFPNIGYKNGAWHATTWYSLQLGTLPVPPPEPVAFSVLERERVTEILENEQ